MLLIADSDWHMLERVVILGHFPSIRASNASGRIRTEWPRRTIGSLPSATIRRTERREMCRISATSAAVRSCARAMREGFRPDMNASPSGDILINPSRQILGRPGGRAAAPAQSACRVRGRLMCDSGRHRHGRESAEAPLANLVENSLSSNCVRSRRAPPFDLRRTRRQANDVLGILRNWQGWTWVERLVARHVIVERLDRVEEPGLSYTQHPIRGVRQRQVEIRARESPFGADVDDYFPGFP